VSTGYTREQLFELTRQIHENLPPEITEADFKGAAKVKELSMAGTDVGVLLRLGFGRGKILDVFLNCAVALELVVGLYAAGQTNGWWTQEYTDRPPFALETPTREDIATSLDVASLRTTSDARGVLIALGSGGTALQVYMPRKVIVDVLAAIQQAADRAGWWDDKMNLRAMDGEKLQ
jgi:phage gp46-like protein